MDGTVLREYLYVDTNLVRGFLAQLDDGITESEATTSKKSKTSAAGVKGFAEYTDTRGTDAASQKSFGDALFPRLESALESEGLLIDVSEEASAPDSWTGDVLAEKVPAGSLVRITAAGALFDSRFVASTLTGFTTAYTGLVNMGILEQPSAPTLPPRAKVKQKSESTTRAMPDLEDSWSALEKGIPLSSLHFGDTVLEGFYVRGIAQLARGLFSPGLHLALYPCESLPATVTVRLQEGRQYLDSDPDVLFARYGVGRQEWTVVGSVGHHAVDASVNELTLDTSDGTVRRSSFAEYVNGFLGTLGAAGFCDLPQPPSFSVVPIAVFRQLGTQALYERS